MATTMINFPAAIVVDGLLSFIQDRFSKPNCTPSAYRWDPDDIKSRIRISGAYAIDNQKPDSGPSITVQRGDLFLENRTFQAGLRTADANTFANPQFQDLFTGSFNIICQSLVASEASSIAEYIALEIQANKLMICSQIKSLKRVTVSGISAENLVRADVQPRRWQVVLRLDALMYFGWAIENTDSIPFNSASFLAVGREEPFTSTGGETILSVDTLIDNTADFGTAITNVPQLLTAELTNKWYYVVFATDDYQVRYRVDSIVNNHQLKLQHKKPDGNLEPFSAPATATGLSYRLEWNSVHFRIELPTNT